LQPKLLRLLQEKRYERVGETQTRVCDVRIIAATNCDLESQIAAGRFREDLFFRLNVIALTLPPLRERVDDILPLSDHLLKFFRRQTGKPLAGFTDEAKAAIRCYAWPGNIRELRNAIERGVLLATGTHVGLADLPTQISAPQTAGMEIGARITLDQVEAEHIRRVLATTPTIDEAADVLGIDPSTLYRKRKKYGL
jgi:NtrC-family two-component system response regulator AlgB